MDRETRLYGSGRREDGGQSEGGEGGVQLRVVGRRRGERGAGASTPPARELSLTPSARAAAIGVLPQYLRACE